MAVQWAFWRVDITADKRHSLSTATCQLLKQTDDKIEVRLYLSGDLNSGFLKLKKAAQETLAEMQQYADIKIIEQDVNKFSRQEQDKFAQTLAEHALVPTAIYERDKQGKTSQTIVYPYAAIRYKNKERWVVLLQNQRGVSGAENLNKSIENLEYNFAQTIHSLSITKHSKVAFLEGHGELSEQYTMDVQQALSEWFDVYRGSITNQADCLNDFAAVIIADPQLKFSEQDKYVLDQYLMGGGKLMWLINGVQFSKDVLTQNGYTPAVALDLNVSDMLFRYGIRVNPKLVTSLHCLSVPVDVSQNPDIPQYEPMSWVYAPLLETSYNSAVTRNISPVIATFASDIDFVGEDDNINRTILLATADYSRAIGVPAEVDLTDLSVQADLFTNAYLPVAVSEEGSFQSLFTHRMAPEGIVNVSKTKTQSAITKQIIVAAGNVIRNELQQGRPLPAGYDRYSRMQFGNRDFVVNSVLWLTDDEGLISLRQKEMPLRLLNEKALEKKLLLYQCISTLLPLILLAVTAGVILLIRKKKYSKT